MRAIYISGKQEIEDSLNWSLLSIIKGENIPLRSKLLFKSFCKSEAYISYERDYINFRYVTCSESDLELASYICGLLTVNMCLSPMWIMCDGKFISPKREDLYSFYEKGANKEVYGDVGIDACLSTLRRRKYFLHPSKLTALGAGSNRSFQKDKGGLNPPEA